MFLSICNSLLLFTLICIDLKLWVTADLSQLRLAKTFDISLWLQLSKHVALHNYTCSCNLADKVSCSWSILPTNLKKCSSSWNAKEGFHPPFMLHYHHVSSFTVFWMFCVYAVLKLTDYMIVCLAVFNSILHNRMRIKTYAFLLLTWEYHVRSCIMSVRLASIATTSSVTLSTRALTNSYLSRFVTITMTLTLISAVDHRYKLVWV